jgi:hypothetical protein
LALKDAENNSFAASATSSKAFDSPRTEVALIELDFTENRYLLLAKVGYSQAKSHEIPVHGVAVKSGDLGDL